ncbi:phosphatidylethanolamine-binding protein [Hypoxylon sp. FL1150]|nr:phosphatidylethanolamine-binding protein [Hypoxylon sp. FL1150]
MVSLLDHADALAASLTEADLVPGPASGLIPPDFKPTTHLAVAFARAAEVGAFFRAGECGQTPHISFGPELDAPADASYTFILVDPDAPTPDDPKFAFWRHYVVSGLKPGPSEEEYETSVKGSGGKVLTAYLGPGPKDDSKPHRYLFLLYREPSGFALGKSDVGGEELVDRRSFKPTEFAEKHGLQLVGVNWMTCAGDGWKE